MNITLLITGGVGCVLAGVASVLLSGKREARVMLGGAFAFLALVLALVSAGAIVLRIADGESTAEEILEQMIEREVR